jgi:hypothetical protein
MLALDPSRDGEAFKEVVVVDGSDGFSVFLSSLGPADRAAAEAKVSKLFSFVLMDSPAC